MIVKFLGGATGVFLPFRKYLLIATVLSDRSSCVIETFLIESRHVGARPAFKKSRGRSLIIVASPLVRPLHVTLNKYHNLFFFPPSSVTWTIAQRNRSRGDRFFCYCAGSFNVQLTNSLRIDVETRHGRDTKKSRILVPESLPFIKEGWSDAIREFCGKRCAARMRIFWSSHATLCAARLKRNGGSKRNPIPWGERRQSRSQREGNSLYNYTCWIVYRHVFYFHVDFLVFVFVGTGRTREKVNALWLIHWAVKLDVAGSFTAAST